MKTDKQIAKAWITIQNNWWAYDMVYRACRSRPHLAWRLIGTISKLATTPLLVRDLGCGPLEDFVRYQAPKYIRRIELRCKKDDRLQRAICYVWLPDASDKISLRLFKLGCIRINSKLEQWQSKKGVRRIRGTTRGAEKHAG